MISKEDVRLAEFILHNYCIEHKFCLHCQHYDNCGINASKWKIINPLPENAERQRIEWLRMLKDKEMLMAEWYLSHVWKCYDCAYCKKGCNRDMPCNVGHMDWWHEVVTLEQFRKDVGVK